MRILILGTLFCFTLFSCKKDDLVTPPTERSIDLHVDNSVSQSGDGSESSPFASIQEALNHAQPISSGIWIIMDEIIDETRR